MNDRGDDELAAIAARWQTIGSGDAPDREIMAGAPADIATLLGAIGRLRQYIDALTPPAKSGMETLPVCCAQLGRYLTDPDNIIDYWGELDQFLLPVRGGTRSGIVIAFCPWCGSPLPAREGDGDDTGTGSI